MCRNKEKLPEKEELKDISYKNIGNGVFDRIRYISIYLGDILDDEVLTEESFKNFLHFFISQKGFKEEKINGTEFKNGKVLIYTKTDIVHKKSDVIYSFDFQEYREYRAKYVLKGEKLSDLEQKIQILHFAMESIYHQNNGIFSEIDETDIINPEKIVKSRKKNKGAENFGNLTNDQLKKLLEKYKGLNLGDLKEELELEQKRLILYYDIIGKSQKSLKLLESQIIYEGAIGDIYDKGERMIVSGKKPEKSLLLQKKEGDDDLNLKVEIKPETRKNIIDFAINFIKWQNKGYFSEIDNEDIVNIGEILKIRKKIISEIKLLESCGKASGYEHLRYYKKLKKDLKIFAGFEKYSDKEFRQLLLEFRGMNISELKKAKKDTDNPELKTEKSQTDFSLENKSFSTQLSEKVESIVKRKSVKELIKYIRVINNKIADNGHIPDMTKEINLFLVKKLCESTFKKMKQKNSETRDFINFARVITGRNLTDENGEIREELRGTGEWHGNIEVQEKIPENIVKINNDFKQTNLARKAILYILYTRKGVEQIGNIKLEDKAYTDTKIKEKENVAKGFHSYMDIDVIEEKIDSVSIILDRSFKAFEEIGLNREELITQMGIGDLVNKEKISELDFNEMLLLGTFYRISKNLKKEFKKLLGMTPVEVKKFLEESNNKALEETFKVLNKSFEKNFDATFWNKKWGGKKGGDFKSLSSENAEIFDLYGEINGRGYFNLADDNFFAETFLTKETGIVLSVGLLTGLLVFPGVITASGGRALAIAGAKIGVTTSIASQIMSDKGYDTFNEMLVGRFSQFGIDITSSTIFTWGSGALIGKMGQKGFSSVLRKELSETGKLSSESISKLKDITTEMKKEMARDFGIVGKLVRTPERLWRKEAEEVFWQLKYLETAGFKGKLSEKSIDYLGRYSATTGFKGNIFDGGVGLGDGMIAGGLEQLLEYSVIDSIFIKNHFIPENGENIYNVKEQRKKFKEIEKKAKKSAKILEKQKRELEKKIINIDLEGEEVKKMLEECNRKEAEKGNTSLGKTWEKLSESEKRKVIGVFLIKKYFSEAKKKVLATLDSKEKSEIINYYGLLYKRNNL